MLFEYPESKIINPQQLEKISPEFLSMAFQDEGQEIYQGLKD